MHYLAPPIGDPQTVQAAREAMEITFFHWGLHAWAIYAIVALILAFLVIDMAYRSPYVQHFTRSLVNGFMDLLVMLSIFLLLSAPFSGWRHH